jgi:hypothetical protein
MADRQLDIPATRSDWFNLPTYAPMRLSAIDFIYFIWPEDIDNKRYTVVIESLDTAGPTFRGIGILNSYVQLPHVQLGWHTKLGLIPDSSNLPVFEAELIRASTYVIPPKNKWGNSEKITMERHGIHRPPGI